MRERYSSTAVERVGGPGPTLGRLVLGLLTGLLFVSVLTGCSGGRTPPEPDAVRPSAVAHRHVVHVHVRITRVAGTLGHRSRQQLAGTVRRLVLSYVDAAFVAHPPKGPAAFPGFTTGAKRMAVHARSVATSAGLGDRAHLTPRRIGAYVAVLAPHRRPAGATVRLQVALAPTGSGGRTEHVGGRLLLTPTSHGWRVFGFALAGSGHPPRHMPTHKAGKSGASR